MNNLLGQTNAKHGIFRFSLNDEYIGNALNEYGEFSEIEFSIMNKFIEKSFIRNLDNSKDYPTISDLMREQKLSHNNSNTVHHRRDLDSLG